MGAAVILVIGGVRSGKSGFAQQVATDLSQGGGVRFVATARRDLADPTMVVRIGEHRRKRPSHWETDEEPLDLGAAITGRKGAPTPAVVLVDCLTLWLTNLLEEAGDVAKPGFAGRARAGFEEGAVALVAALRDAPQPVVIVTNEVGSGVAPATSLGNIFADLQGELNQAVAIEARAVYHVVAGIGTRIK